MSASALEDLSYIVSELGVGLHWQRRVSYLIRNKKQGGSLEVTIQDIITERNYWRQFKTRMNFDRKFAILFDVEKKSRRGEFTKLT